MQFLKNLDKNNLLIILVQILICILFVPYLWYGESIQIRIHDNLDSNVVWLKMALDSGQLFTLGGKVEQMMNGLPIHSVYGAYDISILIFYIFGIFKGYVVCKFLMMFVAFWGMYLLLINHIEKSVQFRWVLICVSFLFAILPFWSFGMHIAGTPFVFFALLNLRNKNTKFYNWLILFIFAFWSSLVLTGFFVLLTSGCLWLYDLVKKKEWNIPFLVGLLFLAICYIASHFPLFSAHFFIQDSYVSIRTEFYQCFNLDLLDAFGCGIQLFENGDTTLSRQSVCLNIFMLIPVFASLVLMFEHKQINKIFLILLIYCFISSLYFGIYESSFFYPIRKIIWAILPLNTTRSIWLNPTFWYIIIAISLVYIAKHLRKGVYIVIFFIVVQLIYSSFQFEYVYYKKIPNVKFKDFYASTQFEDIKQTIGKQQNTYKVASLGIHPTIALYNGFYTIDGFSVDYSIDYKKKFRKIIEKELGKNKNYFDDWGARCYLFIDESTASNYVEKKEYIDRELLFNFDQMKSMGAEYIISANEVNLENNKRLELIGKYPASKYNDRGEGAYWDLYLYKIK